MDELFKILLTFFNQLNRNEIVKMNLQSSAFLAQLPIELQIVEIVQQHDIPGVEKALFAEYFDGVKLL